VEFFRGDAAQNVQRLGGAVLVTILAASKAAVLAAGALTFPFWWPWLQAAKKNGDVKTQYGCGFQGLVAFRALGREAPGRHEGQRRDVPVRVQLELEGIRGLWF
jgi:hypothetical protein